MQAQLEIILVNKSTGPGGIYSQILKILSTMKAGLIALLLNLSLESGIILKDWSRANVSPIRKKVSKHDVFNYIPVTSVLCNSMALYLTGHFLLNDAQYGFLP